VPPGSPGNHVAYTHTHRHTQRETHTQTHAHTRSLSLSLSLSLTHTHTRARTHTHLSSWPCLLPSLVFLCFFVASALCRVLVLLFEGSALLFLFLAGAFVFYCMLSTCDCMSSFCWYHVFFCFFWIRPPAPVRQGVCVHAYATVTGSSVICLFLKSWCFTMLLHCVY